MGDAVPFPQRLDGFAFAGSPAFYRADALRADAAALGWQGGPTTLSGFVQPFDTCADMGQVLASENWSAEAPRSLAYFCSALPEAKGRSHAPQAAGERGKEVRRNAIAFLEGHLRHLWPLAFDGAGRFRGELLADAARGGAAPVAPPAKAPPPGPDPDEAGKPLADRRMSKLLK